MNHESGGGNGAAPVEFPQNFQPPEVDHAGDLTRKQQNKQLDASYEAADSEAMTIALIVLALVALAFTAQRFGVDTRTGPEWSTGSLLRQRPRTTLTTDSVRLP